jgi:hypothetical protein
MSDHPEMLKERSHFTSASAARAADTGAIDMAPAQASTRAAIPIERLIIFISLQ